MSYIYVLAAIGGAGVIWLLVKSRELTAAQVKLRKDQKLARVRFLRGAETSGSADASGMASKRPKFGQR